MFQPQLGVSLITICKQLTAEALQALGQSRVATVEITPQLVSGDGKLKAALQETLRGRGIRAASVHALFGGGEYDISQLDEQACRHAVEQTAAAVDLACDLDAPLVVVHASAEPIAAVERAQRLQQARCALGEIGRHAQQTGRRIAVEILPRTCLGNTVDELTALMSELDAAVFGVCMDTNHLMNRYQTLPDEIRRLGHKLLTLHLSDYDGVDEKHELPGRGVLDWKAFMAALRAIDYRGPFNYEAKPDGATPAERFRSYENNFEWLSKL